MAALDCEVHGVKLDSVAKDICRRNPKSEVRNPKESEYRSPKNGRFWSCSGFVPPCGISGFGARVSDFKKIGFSKRFRNFETVSFFNLLMMGNRGD